MRRNLESASAGRAMVLLLLMLNIIILEQGFVSHPKWYALLPVSLPLMVVYLLHFRPAKAGARQPAGTRPKFLYLAAVAAAGTLAWCLAMA